MYVEYIVSFSFFVIVFSTMSVAQAIYCHQASWLGLDLFVFSTLFKS
jgi:hypothetical protein